MCVVLVLVLLELAWAAAEIALEGCCVRSWRVSAFGLSAVVSD